MCYFNLIVQILKRANSSDPSTIYPIAWLVACICWVWSIYTSFILVMILCFLQLHNII